MSTAAATTLLNQAIPSLYNGVSQQPPDLRLSSQCELQDNAYPSLVDGLEKRPAFLHIAKLNSSTYQDWKVHLINRDPTEQYVVLLRSGTLEVYDLNGNAKTVNFAAGTSYLNVTDPNADFALLTIADYTFIVNKTVTVAMDPAVTSGTLTGTVQTFSDLPTSGMAVGDIYHIVGDPGTQFDDYYVKWTGATWAETAAPGVQYKFDAATMPHKLVRNADGTFTFDVVTWGERKVGDDNSNPIPSFVGQTLTDIFFYRNRVGFLSGENIILSTTPASDLNFWRDSATILIDSDPIDTAASSASVALPKHAVPFDRSLLVFADQEQFVLTGEPILSPSTAALTVTTKFEASDKAEPAAAGPNVYFAVPRGAFTTLREYYVQSDTATNDAANITAHVPSYIPTDVFQLVAMTNEDVLFVLSEAQRNTIWVYKYYWQGDEKVQSAWGTWTLDAGDVVLGLGAIEADLYVVIGRSDGVYLERVRIGSGRQDTGLEFQVLLDRRVLLTGTYDAVSDTTTWTLPYSDSGTFDVVKGGDWPTGAGGVLSGVTRPSDTTVAVTGDYSAYPCYVGRRYVMRYVFSEQFVRDQQRNTIRDGRLMLRFMSLNYHKSAYFKVLVNPDARAVGTYQFVGSYAFTGRVLGTLTLGDVQLVSGSFRFPVLCDAHQVSIEVQNDTPLPSALQSAEWVGLWVAKSVR